MDVRDLYFWARRAQREKLAQFLERIQAARIAMATDEYYTTEVTQLMGKLREYDGAKPKTIEDTWEHLQILKKQTGGK